MFTSVIPFV